MLSKLWFTTNIKKEKDCLTFEKLNAVEPLDETSILGKTNHPSCQLSASETGRPNEPKYDQERKIAAEIK